MTRIPMIESMNPQDLSSPDCAGAAEPGLAVVIPAYNEGLVVSRMSPEGPQ
jgi:hypothetical protein